MRIFYDQKNPQTEQCCLLKYRSCALEASILEDIVQDIELARTQLAYNGPLHAIIKKVG